MMNEIADEHDAIACDMLSRVVLEQHDHNTAAAVCAVCAVGHAMLAVSRRLEDMVDLVQDARGVKAQKDPA